MTKRLMQFGALSFLLAVPAFGAEPRALADDTWISLSGSVEEASADAFVLNQGTHDVTVEMDDWDWYAEGYKLLEGDNVTVYGWVDDDLFERSTIEASAVYVENLDTYFYASGADEEDVAYTVAVPVVDSYVALRGEVTDVRGDEFTLNDGAGRIEVETEEMAENPLDEEGFQRIEVGDLVSVTGEVETEFFEGRVIEADSIVTLREDRGKRTAGS